MSVEDNKRLVVDVFERFVESDAYSALALFHDHVNWQKVARQDGLTRYVKKEEMPWDRERFHH